MKKAKTTEGTSDLRQIPNIGEAIARDLRLIGITKPEQLKGTDGYDLYVLLCKKTKTYHDPCVLDTFLSAVYFMDGKGSKPWWEFTATRKKNYSKVEDRIAKFK